MYEESTQRAATSAARSPTFLVDRNVAALTRRLRWLGYDAVVDPGMDDAVLVDWARREGRVLLTRDRGMLRRRPIVAGWVRALWIASDQPWEQLAQVVRDLEIDPVHDAFSRCVRCNTSREAVSHAQATAFVPHYVSQTQQHFTHCPVCGRFFWRGTHWRHLHEQVLASLSGAHTTGVPADPRWPPDP